MRYLRPVALVVTLLAGCTLVPREPAPHGAHAVSSVPAVASGGSGAAPADGSESLPVDPALVTGALPSGLAYVVTRHPNPAGRAGFWLHVAAGSLDEQDDTRGLAHYLEHMAFNGSANFPPGTLVPYFESIGLSFGRDQNAFTSLDHTVYQIALPDVRPETLSRALLYLGDVATRLSLSAEEIDAERQIILEEKRARAGPEERLREYIFERLAPGATFGRRMPIGTEATIKALQPGQFRDFYARHYVLGNMTVLAVCDCEPELVVQKIRTEFADGPRGARPPPRSIDTTRTAGVRAIVATDRDLRRATVSLTRVEPPEPPRLTVTDARRQLVESMAARAFNRRLDARVAEGRTAFLEAGGSAYNWGPAARLVSVRASGPPERWRGMLEELGATVQQARQHGFSAREIEVVGRAVLAEAEADVQREPTQPARTVLRRMDEAIARGEPIMSAAQRQAVLQRLVPGIEAAEVSRVFAATFDFADVVAVVSLPTGKDVPDEPAVVNMARTALAARPDAPTELAAEAPLLATLPTPGRIVDLQEHAKSGVASTWLGNGVRVHHRLVTQRRHEVTVQITLAGGQIEETAENRGVSSAAALAWRRPATSTLTSTQVRDLMTGRRVRVDGRADSDAMTLTVSGDPTELEHGLQLAYRLLTDPVIEAAAFAQWQTAELQRISARRTEPSGMLGEALADAIYPAGELRTRPLTPEQVHALTRETAQAWLMRLASSAPIEVAVVGDLEREPALDLIARYLGSLPTRPRIGTDTLRTLRAMARPTGPIVVARSVDTATSQAVVLDGFFGADVTNVPDTRLLATAARVLSTRMNRIVREERQLVYSIHANSHPGAEYPGFGLFVAQAPTDPDKTQALATILEELYTSFAKDGPTDDEMRVARAQIDNSLSELLAGPDFWVGRLATLDYRGAKLDDVVAARERYAALTAAEVREAFARYYAPAARVRIVVTPR